MTDDIMYFVLREGKRVVMRRYSLLLRRAEAELDKICEVPGNSVIADQQRTIINGYKSILAAVSNIKTRDFLYEVRQGKTRFDIAKIKRIKPEKEATNEPSFPSLTEIHKKIKKPSYCRWCPECKQLVAYSYFHKHLKSGCKKYVYGVQKFKEQIKNNKKKEGTE